MAQLEDGEPVEIRRRMCWDCPACKTLNPFGWNATEGDKGWVWCKSCHKGYKAEVKTVR